MAQLVEGVKNMMSGISTYSLGDFTLQSGATLPGAWIAYKTFGSSSSPAILCPTWYSGNIADNEGLIGEDKTSTPTSTTSSLLRSSAMANVTLHDNARAEHELLTKELKITHLRAVVGWSLAAGQSFQWATQYPDFMDIIVPICGSAKTSIHNQVFLEGVKSALLAAHGASSAGSTYGRVETKGTEEEGRTWTAEQRDVGLKAFGRGYAGWGFSQAFYRAKLHESAYGAKDLEDFLQSFWEGYFLQKDPENLLVMLHTWQTGDVSKQEPYNGSFEKAMSGIKCKALVLPSKTDLYFPPEDSEYEVKCMRPGVGTLDVFPSIWGHWAGGPPGNMEDTKWLDQKMGKFFAEN